jgi:TPR repeat protein
LLGAGRGLRVVRIVRKTALICSLAIVFSASMPALATSGAYSDGAAAYHRQDYVRAARKLAPLALRGDAKAQALLGFMYANGLGAPQAYVPAVELYTSAAEQGNTSAQYLLGLMYDKGHGVVQDGVIAYKWLNLAAAGASRREREYYLRLRDAVASKMTRAQIAEGQWLALNWAPRRRGYAGRWSSF